MLLPIQAAAEFMKGLQPKEILSRAGAYARTTAWDLVSIQPETGFSKRVSYTQFFIQDISPFVFNHFFTVKKIVDASPLLNLLMHGGLVASFFLNRKQDMGGFSFLPGSKWIAAALATIQVSRYMTGLSTNEHLSIPTPAFFHFISKPLTIIQNPIANKLSGLVDSLIRKSFAKARENNLLSKEGIQVTTLGEIVFSLSYPLSPSARLASISLLALMHLSIATIEELIFRAAIPNALNYIAEKCGINPDHKLTKFSKVIFTSLIFAFCHARYNGSKTAQTFALGLMLGCLKGNGESLKMTITMHFLNNIIAEGQFIERFFPFLLEKTLQFQKWAESLVDD